MNDKTNGQIAYEAYCARRNETKGTDGTDGGRPFWEGLEADVKEAYEALAELRKMAALMESPGAKMIAEEWKRQLDEEHYCPEHDDQHVNGELLHAGLAYLVHAVMGTFVNFPPPFWPWEKKWWKPGPDAERNLVKGCALIAAEIDRRRRANGMEGTEGTEGTKGPEGTPGGEEAQQTGRSALPGN